MTVSGGTTVTGASGYTESSSNNAFVSNYFNRVPLSLFRTENITSWNYTTATYRIANNNIANRINVFCCDGSIPLVASATANRYNTSANVATVSQLGLDSTSTLAARACWSEIHTPGASYFVSGTTTFSGNPGAGLHYLAMLEYSAATGTTTWYGNSGGTVLTGSIPY